MEWILASFPTLASLPQTRTEPDRQDVDSQEIRGCVKHDRSRIPLASSNLSLRASQMLPGSRSLQQSKSDVFVDALAPPTLGSIYYLVSA